MCEVNRGTAYGELPSAWASFLWEEVILLARDVPFVLGRRGDAVSSRGLPGLVCRWSRSLLLGMLSLASDPVCQ